MEKTKNTFNTIFWVFRLIFRLLPNLIFIVFISQLFSSILPLIEQKYLSHLLDNLIGSLNRPDNTWVRAFMLFFLVRIAKIFFLQLDRMLQRVLDFRFGFQIDQLFIEKTASMDYQQYEDKEIASLISKVREEYRWRLRQFIADTLDMASQIIGLSAVIYFLIPHYWYIGILLLVGEIPGMIFNKRWQKIDWDTYNYYSEKNRPLWDTSWQLSSKQYIAELRINNAIPWLLSKIRSSQLEFASARVKNRINKFFPDQFGNLCSVVISAICLTFVVRDIRSGLITVGMFTFYFNIVRNTGDYFANLLNRFISISEQVLYINNFRKIMELTPVVKSGRYKIGLGQSPLIEFRNVSFKYPNSERYIYKDLNLTIHPNEEIAIVGANGAGKSTLIKLICRFYDPTSGDIYINNKNLKDYNLGYWYKQLSFLNQEFNTFQNMTVKENVMIGDIKNQSITSIKKSLDKSQALSFVEKYKHGLNTMMSQRYDGEEPSWGQWQKIAIARVFHRNRPIMILDEPTAAIDAVSESQIFSRLYKETKNKTLIIVSHRFSTVRNAQRIIVIDKGKVVEQGTHEELLINGGLYSQSFSLQAQGYK